jgi:hypothetical protein
LPYEEILELYPFQVLLGIQIKKAEMAGLGHVSYMGRKRKYILMEKPE